MSRCWYLVLADTGSPMMVGHYNDTPRAGVLVIGDRGELFLQRRSAERAIERSRAYASEHGFNWRTDRYKIRKIAPLHESAVS